MDYAVVISRVVWVIFEKKFFHQNRHSGAKQKIKKQTFA
jgi:hypothetical protein